MTEKVGNFWRKYGRAMGHIKKWSMALCSSNFREIIASNNILARNEPFI